MGRTDIRMGFFRGATEAILKLDFEFINLRFCKLYSEEFVKVVEGFGQDRRVRKRNFELFDAWRVDKFHFGFEEHSYALIPVDLTKPANGNHFGLVEEILLIMFPSDFRQHSYIEFSNLNNESEHERTMWMPPSHGGGPSRWQNEYSDGWLKFDDSSVLEINNFIKFYFENVKRFEFLKLAVSSYIQSFRIQPLNLSYVQLAIALESLIPESSEVTHQISRYAAVINSSTKELGQIIYSNTKKLYDLRSKIVHGNQYDGEKLRNFYFKLESLVSSTLIELLSHDISDIKELKKSVNELGFGEREKLSKVYRPTGFVQSNRSLILQPLSLS